MNSHDEKKLSEQYHQVPRVDSPEYLDKQVLEAAHRHTPAKRNRMINHWVPALATVCVAGAVFYISTPVIDSPSDLRPPAAVSETAVISDAVDSFDSDLSEAEVVNNIDAELSSPKVQKKQTLSRVQVDERTATVKGTLRKARKEKLLGLVPQEEGSAKAELQHRDDVGLGASDANEIRLNPEVIVESASPLESQSAAKPAATTSINRARSKNHVSLSAEEISLRIEKINALAEKALDEDANRLLEQLIVQCPDCALPEILAEFNKTVDSEEFIESKQND